MRYIYVNNFRGFCSELIPIKDVNFLVGENSTGKTSILSLIALLTTTDFWYRQDFNTDPVRLGNFKDIVSINATDRKYFKFGYIELKYFNDDKYEPYAFLMKFIERDGLPYISQLHYVAFGYDVIIYFEKDGLKYRVKKIKYSRNPSKTLFDVFFRWIKERKTFSGFKRIKEPKQLRERSPIVSAMHIVERDAFKSQKRRKISVPALTLGRPDFSNNFVWIAPIRSRARRTYDQLKVDFDPHGEHAPVLIKKYIKNKSFLEFIKKFGKNSGLFDSISIRNYGKASNAPFALRVVLNRKHINIVNVGYGVSQSLPVIVEIIARAQRAWFAIQQPEIHLHPRAQASLGTLIYNYAIEKNKKFLVETHSDYLINRFRLNIRKYTKNNSTESQVLFFERTRKGNQVSSIDIERDGTYSENQPKAFRKFFIQEELEILGLK